MLTSYHNHTPRCNHASGEPREYISRAVEAGYESFGFSDHAPHLFRDALTESRMAPEEIFSYADELRALREEWRDRIDIRIGLELEYYPKTHDADMELYRRAGIEYFILGQHLTGNGLPEDHANSFALTDVASRYTAYVDQCIRAMETGCFCYFAHPDVFHYLGDDDFYRAESERLIRAAIRHKLPLEINMYGLSDGRHYPNKIFWEAAGRLGATVILGRDAHSVERVFSEEENAMAESFVKELGLNISDFLLI